MTWTSMPRALSQRANQKPSRPASKATTIRSILRPAFSASSRHRCSSFSNALSSTASFFNGWRSTPGKMPPTSQLDRLISMTAISVPLGSRAVRDRLRSFNFCMGRSIGSHQRRWMQYPRRRPIASSTMEFENEVEQSIGRPCCQSDNRSKRTYELTSSIVPRGTSEASGYVDSNTIGQRYHRADPGHRHQAPAHVIVPDDCKHASVQDADLFAYRPPDDEQRLGQDGQVGQILDQLLYSRFELRLFHFRPPGT